jgi:hypothetical protein
MYQEIIVGLQNLSLGDKLSRFLLAPWADDCIEKVGVVPWNPRGMAIVISAGP